MSRRMENGVEADLAMNLDMESGAEAPQSPASGTAARSCAASNLAKSRGRGRVRKGG